MLWNKICSIFEVLTEFEMKKIVYRIFGKPIVPANTGLVGSTDGRLFIDKAVFFARKDVQAVIKSVKESKVVKEQIEKSHQNIEGNYIDDDKFIKYLIEDKFAFNSRNEARLECLKKLIELCKKR